MLLRKEDGDDEKGDAVFLLLIMLLGMVSMFTACGRIGECEECHQRESLTKFRFEDGSVEWLCDDCLRIAKFFRPGNRRDL